MNDEYETDDQFRERIFGLIRDTIHQCYLEENGVPPPKPVPEPVLRELVCKISFVYGPPENEEELCAKVRRIYRDSRNIAAMRKGLN